MSHTPTGTSTSRGMKPLHAGIILGLAALATGLAATRAGSAEQPVERADLSTASVGGPEAAARESLWRAAASSGRVEWNRGAGPEDPWARVRRGDTLRPSSLVRTARRSRTTLTRQGDVILVDPETRLVLPHQRLGGTARIRQESGNALYEVKRGVGRRVSVETPFLVAGVKGTVFSVIVDESFSSVSVVSGEVRVRSRVTGETVSLVDGEMVIFDGARGEMEVYRESRREARELTGESMKSFRSSRRGTARLIAEATASLMDPEVKEQGWDELRSLDLSIWKDERSLKEDDLESSLDEETNTLRNEEDSKAIKVGVKQR